MKPKIGDTVIFVTCTERAVIRYFVRHIAVCSSNECGILLVPVAQIRKNHRKESKSWRADVHYHFDIYDVERERETLGNTVSHRSLDVARPGNDFADDELSARTISPKRRRLYTPEQLVQVEGAE